MDEREQPTGNERESEPPAGERRPGSTGPMDPAAYAASASESGGLYTEEGPTRGTTDGEPPADEADRDPEPADEPDRGPEPADEPDRGPEPADEPDRGPEPADEPIEDRGEQPEVRPGVGDAFRSGS